MATASSLLLGLLVVSITAAGAGWVVCDTANCGKGTCTEAPGPIPLVSTSYNCTCDPGWSQPKLGGLPPLPFAPCIIPDCTFGSACFNLTVRPPRGIPLTDPCVTLNCGVGGECKRGAGVGYECQCQPGFRNLLDVTSMPCIGSDCTFGPDCAKLGLTSPPGSPAPAPVEGHLLY